MTPNTPIKKHIRNAVFATSLAALPVTLVAPTASAEAATFPANGPITSGYGDRAGGFHGGIDIGAPCGTPIYAAQSGTVIAAGPASGYGQWIRIQHDDGAVSEYGHMYPNDLLVSAGEWVEGGQQIARVGSNGQSTGCHLHFEVEQGGSTVNPSGWLGDATQGGVQADPAPAADAAPVADVSSSPDTHTVQAGETLSSIAAEHGISGWKVLHLRNLDQVKDPDMIYVGQVLTLPS